MAQLNLYCAENGWDEEDNSQEESFSLCSPAPLLQNLLNEQLSQERDELVSLASKEKSQKRLRLDYIESLRNDNLFASTRKEAVEWILSVIAHYSFTTHTAVLSVNFLDRFLSTLQFQGEKPWMTQLAAVACLSLGAKVEETQVPFLLDLQVEETKYVFEAKTIQRMELLVLSALEWKMHPVTPLSFIYYVVRKLGLSNHQRWEFFIRCEQLLLSLIRDYRFVHYAPAIIASSIMLSVISQLESSNPTEYENQLLGVMEISMEEVRECLQLIKDSAVLGHIRGQKRKLPSLPGSPRGVFDAYFNSDSTNDSWASSSSSSLPEDLPEKAAKKGRMDDPQLHTSPFSQVIVDVFGAHNQ
ncbi:cyclin-D3-1-like isoform X2 [Nymphaea colorata]|uniref:cyclin-D3-1-like isoform X2 n=1 Tax=Nymphaea colorata TaxID=210225 RepID=UPI00129E159B|nr:cyclin-D3-1-like isoform X2 [Nymphaea colorata]